MLGPLAANVPWWLSCAEGRARFEEALNIPEASQAALLQRCLARNANTLFGKKYGFGSIYSSSEFQKRVPLTTYEDYEPYIEQITEGRQRVLSRSAVTVLQPTSGSTSAAKLIPYTRDLQAEFNRAIHPWIFDLFLSHPQLLSGTSYWSISPSIHREFPDSKVPIGFADDTDYLGSFAKHLVNQTLAVPSNIQHIEETMAFQYVTLLFLLRSRDLSFISVWHPTFLTLLLSNLNEQWPTLIRDISQGTISIASDLPPSQLMSRITADPRRANELDKIGPDDFHAIWPKLSVISLWGDGQAKPYLNQVKQLLPGIILQEKGLLATEAFVTIPYRGLRPLAIRSHFYEFIDDAEKVHLAHELHQGETYKVVVTTSGGLYRYQLNDLVKVTSLVGRTPSLEFICREGQVSDLFGEKLSEPFVGSVLDRLFRSFGTQPNFAILAPEERNGHHSYVLFVETDEIVIDQLSAELEHLLQENPNYRYCIQLGQLHPARIATISERAADTYFQVLQREGMQRGNIKPRALSNRLDWSSHFKTQRNLQQASSS